MPSDTNVLNLTACCKSMVKIMLEIYLSPVVEHRIGLGPIRKFKICFHIFAVYVIHKDLVRILSLFVRKIVTKLKPASL